jgi:hypothetical protein
MAMFERLFGKGRQTPPQNVAVAPVEYEQIQNMTASAVSALLQRRSTTPPVMTVNEAQAFSRRYIEIIYFDENVTPEERVVSAETENALGKQLNRHSPPTQMLLRYVATPATHTFSMVIR